MAEKKKKKQEKKAPGKDGRSPVGREVKVLLASLFLVVFLVGTLALVQWVRDSLRPESRPGTADGRTEVAPETTPERSVLAPDQRLPAEMPAPEPQVPMPDESGPRAAIIMDDLGQNFSAARDLVAIDLSVTFAVMPETPYAADTAKLAHAAGREVLIHLPMEPLRYPAIHPGTNALLVELSSDELRQRVRSYIPKVPYAVGGNNHMGSRFTMDAEKLAPVLEEMKAHGLFFVDSVTSGSSVAFEEAQRLGLDAGKRDLFLDNVQDVTAIRQELLRLIALAKRRGAAVGICHPYPQTLEALRLERKTFAREGVVVVPVSRLLSTP